MDTRELPSWTFEIEEVSAGVYRVTGRDRAGRTVESCGEDPDAILAEAKAAAAVIDDRSTGHR